MSASPNPSDPPRGAPPRALTRLPLVGPLFASLRQEDPADNPFALAALERHKREGMELAFRARLFAMAVIAIVVPILNPAWDALWYEFLVLCFVLIGYAQRRVAEVGQSGREVGLIVADAYDATILRSADEVPMNGNRRRTQTLRFARTGASRLAGRDDPSV